MLEFLESNFILFAGIGVFLLLFLLLLLLLYCMGAFKSIKFVEKEENGIRFLYRDLQVDYHRLIPHFGELERIAKGNELLSSMSERGRLGELGIFYDNPMAVKDRNKCRCSIGFFVGESDKECLEGEIVNKMEREFGMKCVDLPQVRVLHTSYPYVNKASFALAAMRVYPALFKYLRANSTRYTTTYPIFGVHGLRTVVIEIYEEKRIRYILPLTSGKEKYFISPYEVPAPRVISDSKKTD